MCLVLAGNDEGWLFLWREMMVFCAENKVSEAGNGLQADNRREEWN
jgi:hypothetical protein